MRATAKCPQHQPMQVGRCTEYVPALELEPPRYRRQWIIQQILDLRRQKLHHPPQSPLNGIGYIQKSMACWVLFPLNLYFTITESGCCHKAHILYSFQACPSFRNGLQLGLLSCIHRHYNLLGMSMEGTIYTQAILYTRVSTFMLLLHKPEFAVGHRLLWPYLVV